jgi:hypothetical protein
MNLKFFFILLVLIIYQAVPRGIEPRYPDFHPGAYPFCQDTVSNPEQMNKEFRSWKTRCSELLTHLLIRPKQIQFINYAKALLIKRRAKGSNLRIVSDSRSLASRHIPALSALLLFFYPAERRRFELLRLLHPDCFQDSFHDQPGSLRVSGDYFRRTHIADEERFELSTLPLTTGRSAGELFIQSIGR